MHQKSVLHIHIIDYLWAILREKSLAELVLVLHSIEHSALDQVRVLDAKQLAFEHLQGM